MLSPRRAPFGRRKQSKRDRPLKGKGSHPPDVKSLAPQKGGRKLLLQLSHNTQGSAPTLVKYPQMMIPILPPSVSVFSEVVQPEAESKKSGSEESVTTKMSSPNRVMDTSSSCSPPGLRSSRPPQADDSSSQSRVSHSPLLARPRLKNHASSAPERISNSISPSQVESCPPQLSNQSDLTFAEVITAIAPLYVTPFQLQAPDTPRYPIFDINWRLKATNLDCIEAMRRKDPNNASGFSIEEIYTAVMRFVDENATLQEGWAYLHKAFRIKANSNRKSVNKTKTMQNNLTYKIRRLWSLYPHLRFYGEEHQFTFRTVCKVPEVLITVNNHTVREQFQAVQVRTGRVSGRVSTAS